MTKKLAIPQLVKKADAVFSKWIRSRDSVPGLYIQTEEGLSIPCGYCISCSKITPTEGRGTGDAGHFIKRSCKPLRFNELNVNLQCTRCNHFMSGNDGRYAVALDRKYGPGTAATLQEIEDDYRINGYKWTRDELEQIIERYRRMT